MSLALPSQLLLQQDLPERALLINPPQDDLASNISTAWTVASFSYGVDAAFKKAGFITQSITELPTEKFSSVYIFLPKAKARLRYIIDYACNCLAPDAEIFFVGENKGGIKSLAKSIKADFVKVDKLTTGKHSAIVAAAGPISIKEFVLDSYFVPQENELGLTLNALPGVFSQDHIDKGTQVLLANLPRKIKGRILDFGCGAGVIGAHISKNYEFEELEMIDDDLLAIKSAQKNIETNQMLLSECFASDGLENANMEERYTWIISNPPFHQGVKTHYNVTEKFLNQVKDYLKLSGKLLIVANEFLNYEVTLQEHFKGIKVLANERGYKVIQCEGIVRKKTK
jgi:16S rRNA (guanine1207-N2)-methyltransferase